MITRIIVRFDGYAGRYLWHHPCSRARGERDDASVRGRGVAGERLGRGGNESGALTSGRKAHHDPPDEHRDRVHHDRSRERLVQRPDDEAGNHAEAAGGTEQREEAAAPRGRSSRSPSAPIRPPRRSRSGASPCGRRRRRGRGTWRSAGRKSSARRAGSSSRARSGGPRGAGPPSTTRALRCALAARSAPRSAKARRTQTGTHSCRGRGPWCRRRPARARAGASPRTRSQKRIPTRPRRLPLRPLHRSPPAQRPCAPSRQAEEDPQRNEEDDRRPDLEVCELEGGRKVDTDVIEATDADDVDDEQRSDPDRRGDQASSPAARPAQNRSEKQDGDVHRVAGPDDAKREPADDRLPVTSM